MLFDEVGLDSFEALSKTLYLRCLGGNFTIRENFHTTLEFIGEVDATELLQLQEILESLSFSAFSLETMQLHFFKTKGSQNVLTITMKDNPELTALSKNLRGKLKTSGIPFQDRPLIPHVTLCRKAKCDEEELIAFRPKKMILRISKVSLMQSIQENGRLIYKELSFKNAKME